jgi:hypothetical protein
LVAVWFCLRSHKTQIRGRDLSRPPQDTPDLYPCPLERSQGRAQGIAVAVVGKDLKTVYRLDSDLAGRGVGLGNLIEAQIERSDPVSESAEQSFPRRGDLLLGVAGENGDTVSDDRFHVRLQSVLKTILGSSFVHKIRSYYPEVRKIRIKSRRQDPSQIPVAISLPSSIVGIRSTWRTVARRCGLDPSKQSASPLRTLIFANFGNSTG